MTVLLLAKEACTTAGLNLKGSPDGGYQHHGLKSSYRHVDDTPRRSLGLTVQILDPLERGLPHPDALNLPIGLEES